MGALTQAILSSLGGAGADYGEAKIRQRDEARVQAETELRRQQVFSQIKSAAEAQRLGREQMAFQKLIQTQKEAALKQEHTDWEQSTWEKPLRYKGADGKIWEYNPVLGKTRPTELPEEVLTQTEKSKFGDWEKLPTGEWARPILDAKTLAPTGRYEVSNVGPLSALQTQRTVYKTMTDKAGNQYLVPVEEQSGKVVPGGATTTASARKGRSTTSSKGKSTAPPTTNVDSEGNPLPRGAIAFGAKPLDTMSRRSLVAAKQAKAGVDRLLSLFSRQPELQGDNNPITPAVSWLEYQHGHFEPPEPNATLIREAALIGITASGLYSQGRMSRYLFDKAQQHLPQPNDSPQLLYSKTKWLSDNRILDDMMKDIMNPMRGDSQPQFNKAIIEINGKQVEVPQP